MLEPYSTVHSSHAPAAHGGFLQGISIAENALYFEDLDSRS